MIFWALTRKQNYRKKQRRCDIAGDIRNLSDTDIQEAVSTRLLVYSAKLMVKGFDAYEACIHTIVQSLSDEEEVLEVLEKLVALYFTKKTDA